MLESESVSALVPALTPLRHERTLVTLSMSLRNRNTNICRRLRRVQRRHVKADHAELPVPAAYPLAFSFITQWPSILPDDTTMSRLVSGWSLFLWSRHGISARCLISESPSESRLGSSALPFPLLITTLSSDFPDSPSKLSLKRDVMTVFAQQNQCWVKINKLEFT